MARWTKGSTKFSVSVAPSVQTRTSLCHIPKPVLERLGNPPGLTFRLCRGWPHHGRCLGQNGESLFLSIIHTLATSAAHATTPSLATVSSPIIRLRLSISLLEVIAGSALPWRANPALPASRNCRLHAWNVVGCTLCLRHGSAVPMLVLIYSSMIWIFCSGVNLVFVMPVLPLRIP